MQFLIDEDVPAGLVKSLISLGHDAVRVTPSSPDLEIAKRVKEESRVLVTLDKDFTNTALYSPHEMNIVHIHIHPPYSDTIINSFKKLLSSVPPVKIQGLTILEKEGHIKVPAA